MRKIVIPILLSLLVISTLPIQQASALEEFSFLHESEHYAIGADIFFNVFNGVGPIVGQSVGVLPGFKPLPAKYWNNTITVLNLTVMHTHFVGNTSTSGQDFNESVTLNTGTGKSWTYTTTVCTTSCTQFPASNGPIEWDFTPKNSGQIGIRATIKLIQPPFPAESTTFSFGVANQSSAATAATTITNTVTSTSFQTLTTTNIEHVTEPPVYLVTSTILAVVLASTILWSVVRRRRP